MKVKNLVPDIYYRKSRDFSYVGRVFEVLFNYLKTNVDMVALNTFSQDIPHEIIELLSTTLGFEKKHPYISSDQIDVCNSFIYLLRNKGTQRAIEDSVNILLHSQGIEAKPYFDWDSERENKRCIIYIPVQTKDTIILEDLFDYILPVGYTYVFRYGDLSGANEDEYYIEDKVVEPIIVHDYQLAQVSNSGNQDEQETNIDENVIENRNRSMTYTGVVAGNNNTSSSTQNNTQEEE